MHRCTFVRPYSQAHVSDLVSDWSRVVASPSDSIALFLSFSSSLSFSLRIFSSLSSYWENISRRERERERVLFVFFSFSPCIFASFLVCKDATRDLWSPRRPSSDLIIRYPASKRNRSLSQCSLFFVLQRSPRRRCDHMHRIQIVSRHFCHVTVIVVDFPKLLVMFVYVQSLLKRWWNFIFYKNFEFIKNTF